MGGRIARPRDAIEPRRQGRLCAPGMAGACRRREARSARPRPPPLHFRPGGAEDAVSGRRSWPRRRAVPALAPESRPHREGARGKYSSERRPPSPPQRPVALSLGGPTGLPPKVTPEQRAKGSAATAQLARDFAERLRPVLAGLDGPKRGGPGVQRAPRRQHGQWWRLVRGGGVICLAISRGVRGELPPRRSRLASKRFLAIRGRNVRHQPAKRRPRARMLTVLRSTGLWQ